MVALVGGRVVRGRTRRFVSAGTGSERKPLRVWCVRVWVLERGTFGCLRADSTPVLV